VNFTHLVAIDWSGAKGTRHKSIAVAVCTTGSSGAPTLVAPSAGPWSREAVLGFLIALQARGARPLVAFDFSFAPPFDADFGYFRAAGHQRVPRSAFALWQYVDALCMDTDPDLGAASFIERHHREDFYLGRADGAKAERMRLRACETAFNAQGGAKPSSIFDCVGAAQVGKASFSGMRLLHRLRKHMPVWPFSRDAFGPDFPKGLVVEMYARAFIQHAGLRGNKVRDLETLNGALAALDSSPHTPVDGNVGALSDHETDAIIAAAGLRKLSLEPRYWQAPFAAGPRAKREGWTFGVLPTQR
jgi:hypothetical protein